jgi:hypothetical protein
MAVKAADVVSPPLAPESLDDAPTPLDGDSFVTLASASVRSRGELPYAAIRELAGVELALLGVDVAEDRKSMNATLRRVERSDNGVQLVGPTILAEVPRGSIRAILRAVERQPGKIILVTPTATKKGISLR